MRISLGCSKPFMHYLLHSFIQQIFPESYHIPDTALSATDLRVNEADGVPALLELPSLERKAVTQRMK